MQALQPLQQQLLETELRAQQSEERALKAEFALKEALNKIITLERQVKDQESKPKQELKGDTNKVAMTHRKAAAPAAKSRSNTHKVS